MMALLGSEKRCWRWLAVAAMLGLVLVGVFWRAATGQGIFFFGDILRLYYPERVAFWRAWEGGGLGLWSPDIMGGYPLAAEGEFGPFYPPNWLLAPLPQDLALNAFVLGHYALAGLGMYWLLRRAWGRDVLPSALSALVFMLCGFNVAHLNHLNILAVTAWTPILSGAVILGLRDRRWRWWVAALLGWAMMLLAGQPQIAMLGALLALAQALPEFAVGRQPSGRGRLGQLGGIAAVFVGGALLAAVQLAPTLELTMRSVRSAGLDEAFLGSFSLHPALTMLFASPFLLGDPYPDLSVELVGYLGILPLLLAVWGLGTPERRAARLYAGLAAVGLFLALGRWNPLYGYLLRVPVFNWFRGPARFLLWYTFALSVLVGFGMERLLGEGKKPLWPLSAAAAAGLSMAFWGNGIDTEGWLVAWRWLPLVLLAVSAMALWLRRAGRLSAGAFAAVALAVVALDLGAFAQVYNGSYNGTMIREAFNAAPRTVAWLAEQTDDPYRIMTHEDILPVMSVMRASLYPNLSMLHGVQAANGYGPLVPVDWLAFRQGMDGAALNGFNVRYCLIPQVLPVDEASEFYDLENPFAPTLVGRRLAVDGVDVIELVVESYTSHSVHLADGALAARIVLNGDGGQSVTLPLRMGFDTAEWAYDRSDVLENIQHAQPTVARAWEARSGFPAEDHGGYTYEARYRLDEPLMVDEIEIEPVLPLAYVRVERIWLVDAAGGRHLLSHMIGQGDHTLAYRDEDVAIYENHDALPRAYGAVGGTDGDGPLIALDSGWTGRVDGSLAVAVTDYTDQRVTLAVEAARPGHVVLADAYWPGWQATVDGIDQPIHRANGYLRAVAVPAGRSTVAFTYRPIVFRLGAGLSGLTAMALALGGWWHWRAKGRKEG